MRVLLGEADVGIGMSPKWGSHSAAEPERHLAAGSTGLQWLDGQQVVDVREASVMTSYTALPPSSHDALSSIIERQGL